MGEAMRRSRNRNCYSSLWIANGLNVSLLGCTMCADVHVESRQQCDKCVTGERLYGCFDKLILQGRTPCKCAIG